MAESASDVLQVNQQFLNMTPEDADVFGITQQNPKFPQFAKSSKRMESFKAWPDYLPVTPEVLVEAGLVYTGIGDSVRCFYCGGGLRNWERNDSPWEEHARWYSDCPHVLLVKGLQFVKKVKAGEQPDSYRPDSEVVVEVPLSQFDLINTVGAQACLQMGYKQEQVQKAINRYCQIPGHSTDFKGKDLCNILIDMEEEEASTEVNTIMIVPDSNIEVRHSENNSDSNIDVRQAVNVPESNIEVHHAGNVSDSYIEVRHDEHVPDSNQEVRHGEHVPDSNIEVRHAGNVPDSYIEVRQGGNVSDPNIEVSHDENVPDSNQEVRHAENVPDFNLKEVATASDLNDEGEIVVYHNHIQKRKEEKK